MVPLSWLNAEWYTHFEAALYQWVYSWLICYSWLMWHLVLSQKTEAHFPALTAKGCDIDHLHNLSKP